MKEITEEDIWTDDSGLEWVNADQAKRMEEELLRLREEVKEKDKRIDELEQFNKRFAQEATILDFRGSQLFTKEALQSKEDKEVCECGDDYSSDVIFRTFCIGLGIKTTDEIEAYRRYCIDENRCAFCHKPIKE